MLVHQEIYGYTLLFYTVYSPPFDVNFFTVLNAAYCLFCGIYDCHKKTEGIQLYFIFLCICLHMLQTTILRIVYENISKKIINKTNILMSLSVLIATSSKSQPFWIWYVVKFNLVHDSMIESDFLSQK